MDRLLSSNGSCTIIFTVLFGMLITSFEILSPFLTFIYATTITTEIKATTLFNSLTHYYYLQYFVCCSCLFLMLCFVLQFYFTFKKKVQVLRHIANFVFVIMVILESGECSKSNENQFRLYLANNWENLTVARDFESQYNCDSLSFTNKTNSQYCDTQINEKIDIVFESGRATGAWCSLFISSISVYYGLGALISIFNR